MNILILGSGAREHALGWKISQSPLAGKLYFAPGNAGTAKLGKNITTDVSDHAALATFCHTHTVGFVIPGSDNFYAAGVVDDLIAEGILTFGPTKAAAEIEWSKAYAKEIMHAASVPTAHSETFSDITEAEAYLESQSFPIVIKADGLASGKGVHIAKTPEEARRALHAALVENSFGEAGHVVVIEEFLEGAEISIHALCTDTDTVLFPASQDHKRAFDSDQGPNTGGMGTVAPANVPPALMQEIRNLIILPTLAELKKRGRPFNGLLYPGIMLTKNGPKVIEFNARFGDPEAQTYMRLLKSDLLPALVANARGSMRDMSLQWSGESAACVVMTSGGYPGAYEIGKSISGIEDAKRDGVIVFHSGTARNKDGELITNGGRVLSVTATGKDLPTAMTSVYGTVRRISFERAHYRKDIGAKAIL